MEKDERILKKIERNRERGKKKGEGGEVGGDSAPRISNDQNLRNG